MPTNSNYDGYFNGIGKAPFFTYGMITVTTLVLAYMTVMDNSSAEDENEVKKETVTSSSVVGEPDSTITEGTPPSPPQEEGEGEGEESPPVEATPPSPQEGEGEGEGEGQPSPQEQEEPAPKTGGKRKNTNGKRKNTRKKQPKQK
jgi:hypothetical protein